MVCVSYARTRPHSLMHPIKSNGNEENDENHIIFELKQTTELRLMRKIEWKRMKRKCSLQRSTAQTGENDNEKKRIILFFHGQKKYAFCLDSVLLSFTHSHTFRFFAYFVFFLSFSFFLMQKIARKILLVFVGNFYSFFSFSC